MYTITGATPNNHIAYIPVQRDYAEGEPIDYQEVTQSSVYATFEYNGNTLDHTFFVDDLSNIDDIKAQAAAQFAKFQSDIDNIATKSEVPTVFKDSFGIE